MKRGIKNVISIMLIVVMVFGAMPFSKLLGLELPKLNLFTTKASAASDEMNGMTVTVSGTVYCKDCMSYVGVGNVSILNMSASDGNIQINYKFSLSYHRVSTIACNGANKSYYVTVNQFYNSNLLPCGSNINTTKNMHDSSNSYPDHTVRLYRPAGCTVSKYTSNNDNTHSGTCSLGKHVVTKACNGSATCTLNATCSVCKGVVTACDNHDWGDWTSAGNNTHSRVCLRDSSHMQVQSCTGGSATCKSAAICSVCSGNYLDPNNHESDEFAYVENSEDMTKHNKVYSCCGMVAEIENHTWEYSAKESTITATCNTNGCSNAYGGYITVLVPKNCYVDGYEKNIVIINNLVDSSADIDIVYSTEDGSAPKQAGQYTAFVTLGDASTSICFVIEEYTITWVVDDEKTVETVNVGTQIIVPVEPKKIGYTFEGWTPEVLDVMPAENLTFTATFAANSYDAVFDANGGEWNDGEITKTGSIDFDSEIIAPENPSRQGYDFAGWDSEIGVMDDINGKTFSAQWAARNDTKYTVETYIMNAEGEYVKTVQNYTGETDSTAKAEYIIEEGFKLNEEKSVISGIIAADNSLVLKVYIDRNKYILTSVVDGEITETEYLYGSIVAEPANPIKTGYTFVGWTPEVPAVMSAENITVTAVFDVNSYDAVFNANGGTWSDGASKKTVVTDFDSEIVAPENPSRQGYDFAGWSPSVGIMDDVNGKTFSAQWTARNDTVYTVETYTMNAEGEYVKSVQNYTGETDSTANAEYIIEKGFKLNEEKSVISGGISADNSLVLKVYIDRKKYKFTSVVDGVTTETEYLYGSTITEPTTPVKTGYTFVGWTPEIPTVMTAEDLSFTAVFTPNSYDAVFNANGGQFDDGTDSKTVETTFGETIVAPGAPTKSGYDFAGWEPTVGTMDTEGKTFTAQWTARKDTKYTVETYTMNTAGEYDKITVNFNGTTDETIILNPDVSIGFTLNSEKSVLQGAVTADNSLVLKIYLDRNIYTITKIVDGETTETEYLYGSTIAEPVTPVKTGYTFAGWTPEIPATMPAEDLTVTAQFTVNSYDAVFNANGGTWSDGASTKIVATDFDSEIIAPENPSRQGYDFAGWDSEIGVMDDINGKTFTAQWTARNDTKYIVETYTMNAEGEYVKTVQNYTGETDSTVNADYNIAKGFKLNEEKSVLSGVISSDNSLVLKVYFDRNKYTFTTVVDGETTETEYLYGSIIAEPATPAKTGYTFAGWDKVIPATMPAEDLTVTAQFTVNSYDAVFNANGGTWSDGASIKTVATDFDSEIIAPENPSRQGYDFAGWDSEIGIMDDVNGKTFSAKWTARNDTVYTVETYTMDIYGKYSVVKETKNGTTDTEATVTANAQPGFTFNNAKSKLSGNVAADCSLVLKVFYDRNTYTFTTVVEGKTTSNSYYFDAPVTLPANPVKSGYKFTGWDKTIPSKMPANDVTVTAKFELSFKMSIRNPSTTTIKYGDKIILHADMNEALPSGWTIKWTADNGNFSYSVSADGPTCTISPNKSGSTNFKAIVYDEKGNVICEDTQSMTSKAGFFDKIGAFFRKLFGSTKTIPQLFKGIF